LICPQAWIPGGRPYRLTGRSTLSTKEVDRLKGVAQVGNDDTAAYDQGNVQCLVQFLIAQAGFHALDEVIVDAVIAAQDGGCDQPQKLFGLGWQGAILVGFGVEVEEALDAKMASVQDALVQTSPVGTKFI
jgi:hypothetical protein